MVLSPYAVAQAEVPKLLLCAWDMTMEDDTHAHGTGLRLKIDNEHKQLFGLGEAPAKIKSQSSSEITFEGERVFKGRIIENFVGSLLPHGRGTVRFKETTGMDQRRGTYLLYCKPDLVP